MYKLTVMSEVDAMVEPGETPAKPETTVQVVVSTFVSVRLQDISEKMSGHFAAVRYNRTRYFIMILCVLAT